MMFGALSVTDLAFITIATTHTFVPNVTSGSRVLAQIPVAIIVATDQQRRLVKRNREAR